MQSRKTTNDAEGGAPNETHARVLAFPIAAERSSPVMKKLPADSISIELVDFLTDEFVIGFSRVMTRVKSNYLERAKSVNDVSLEKEILGRHIIVYE